MPADLRYIRPSKTRAEMASGRNTCVKLFWLRARLCCSQRARLRPSKKPIKIGFISTFSGPVAVIGNDMRNSFELALDHLGRKMGGIAG